MNGNHEGPGQMPDKPHPIIFIHGLWLHKSSWVPWESMFEQSGYRVLSPGWPGDQETVELARANPDSVADSGIDDVVEHFASIIGGPLTLGPVPRHSRLPPSRAGRAQLAPASQPRSTGVVTGCAVGLPKVRAYL